MRIRNAAAKAAAIPIAGQPDARAVAGIQRLAPMAVPMMAPTFQENRVDVLEFMFPSANDAGQWRAVLGTQVQTDASSVRSLHQPGWAYLHGHFCSGARSLLPDLSQNQHCWNQNDDPSDRPETKQSSRDWVSVEMAVAVGARPSQKGPQDAQRYRDKKN